MPLWLVGLWAFPGTLSAQVSGTWVGAAAGTWEAASNWTSNPSFPANGGTAVFNGGATSVTLASPETVGTLRFDTSAQINIGLGQLALASPANIEVLQSKQSAPGTLYYFGHEIAAQLSVSSSPTGAPNVRITGPGALVLKSPSSSWLTTTTVDGGARLGLTSSTALGQTSNILLNNGTLRTLAGTGTTLTAVEVSRPIQIHPNGGTLAGITAPLRVTSVISGGGPLSFSGLMGVTLTGANTWAGAARVVGGGTVALTINSLGSLSQYNSMDVSGVLNVAYDSGSLNDRLGLGTLSLHGGTLNLVNYNGTEQIGTLVLAGGHNQLRTTDATSGTFTLQSDAMTRRDRGTLLVKAEGLGIAPPANRVSRIFFDHPETIPHVGGSGAAGTPYLSIVPFATSQTAAGSISLLTYDATLGLRPLNTTTEYVSTLPAEDVSAANVRYFSGVITAAKTVNSLIMSPGSAISGNGTLTLTSGVLVGATSLNGATFSAPLDFGAAEGVVTGVTSLLSPVSGTNGITLVANNFSGGMIFGNVASTYSGTTTLNSGTVQLNLGADVIAGQPGLLGVDTSPVVLAGRSTGATLILSGTSVRQFGRDLVVQSDPEVMKGFEPVLRLYGPQMNGSISLEGPMRVESQGQGTAARITGIISGPGRLALGNGSSSAMVALAGANTFSGGVDLGNSFVSVEHDQALGTGTLFVGGSSISLADGTISIGTVGLTNRTLANPIVLTAGVRFAGQGTLMLTGPIDLNGDVRTISFSAAVRPTVAGPVFGGELRWIGAGTLSGDNAQRATYINTISTLTAVSDHALGVASRLTQVGTANLSLQSTLDLHGGVTIPAHPMTLYGTLLSTGGINAWGGMITAAGVPTISVSSDSLTVAGGITGSATGEGLRVVKIGPGTLASRFVRTAGELRIVGGTAQLIPNGTAAATSAVGSLTLTGSPGAWTSTLDVANNALIIDYPIDSPAADAASMLASGYAGGAWTGPGIVSSTAAGNAGAGVGYAESQTLFGPGGGTFGGMAVDDTSLLLRYTLYGDTDLSGTVDLDDFTSLAATFGTSSTWSGGDSNYDAVTNLDDFTALAANFGLTLPLEIPRSEVPEPVGAAALGAGSVACLLGRRRRG